MIDGLPPLGRPPHEYGPAHQQQPPPQQREHDPRWAANGNSVGDNSSAGGWGSSSGGHQSGPSDGGVSGNTHAGNRQFHDSFASTQKPAAQTPERASQRPSPVPERSRAAAYTPDFSPQRPSPVPGRSRTPELSNASTPTTGQMADYSYPASSRKINQLPDYMKVFTVPKDVHYEGAFRLNPPTSPRTAHNCDLISLNGNPCAQEDVIIEPIIQNLGIGDKDMERKITEQMGNLYDFFRRLYDQDQDEIRCLQAQMEQRDLELRRLRRGKLLAHGEEAAGASPQTPNRRKQRDRDQLLSPTRHIQTSVARQSVACSPPPPSPPKPPSKPVVSLMVPPVLSPARPFFKWWANVQDLYTQRSTLWQGLLFLLLLVLSVGLLAGLLTTRSSNTSRAATYASITPPATPPDPAVTGLWSTGLTFSANMTQGSSAFFALVPTVSLLASSNYTPVAADVKALLQGPAPSPLRGLAVACGERTAMQSQSFTFSVAASSIVAANVSTGGGGAAASSSSCEVTGALPDRCSLCPDVRPATSYTLLVVFSDSEELFEMQATTAPLPSTSPDASSPPPSLPPPPSPPSLPPPSPPSPPPPSPPLVPGASPVAPSFKLAPTVSATGPASFDLSFSLTGVGLVRFLVMHPVLYAQAGDVFVSFASADPVAGQTLEIAPAPSQTLLGYSGVVAAGTVNATADMPYTVRVDGALAGGTNSLCSCGARSCSCAVAAPCQGQMCDLGPSALTSNTTYKVFVSASTPDGVTDTQGPVYVGAVTTAVDTLGPALSQAATIAQKTITPSGFSLTGLQLDTEGFIYVMVSRPSAGQQSIPAGTATALKEDVVAARRRQLMAARGRARGLQQASGQPSNATAAAGVLFVTDTAPAAQVFTPACPRQVPCDTATVSALYLDQTVETLALPVRCVTVASIRDGSLVQVLDGLANDTAYTVRVVTEDVSRNQRVYRALVRTVDRRPPDITAASVQTAFRSFNLTVTLSEPGALVGFLYTAAGAANISLTATSSWPPTPQGVVIQQIGAATAIPSNGSAPTGPATYVLSFNDSSISPKTSYSVALVARDLTGNVQPSIRLVAVRTDDNIPPIWLAAAVQPRAVNATLALQLDEPSTAFWFCLAGNVSCPSASALFGAIDSNTSVSAGLVSRGDVSITIDGGNATAVVSGLRDGALYTLCLVAQDASPLQNRQLNTRRLAFSTFDRTPPTLLVAVMPGTDGNFTCDRSTSRCRLSLNVSLSEPGTSVLALQYADVRSINFTADTLIATDLNAPPAGVLRAVSMSFSGAGSLEVHLPDLASGQGYSLDLAAVDTSGNIQPLLQSLALTAPDVMPPALLSYSAASVADTFITVNVSLSEPGTVLWQVVATGSQAPNATQLVTAVQANKTLLVGSTAYAPAVAGGAVAWRVGGLVLGRVYDVHILARDASGNQQASVTSVLRVRVQDSTPPIIHSLTTSLAPTGNRLMISVNASKPGTLLYVAVRPGAAIPTRQQLLQPAAFNFSGQVPVPAALGLASSVICVLDGGSYEIWAVQEDTEGQYPNRQPNYSNITRATQLPQSSTDSGTCSPESRMRALMLDTALASGSFGWPVGRIAPAATSSTSGNASWVRDYLLIGGLGGGVGSNGSVVVSMEGQQLGYLEFQPTRPPPTQMRVVLQTPTLYLEPAAAVTSLVADTGRMLRFAFQLLDAASRPTAFDGLRVVPRLSASGAYGALVLPDCSITMAAAGSSSSLPSGAGVCRVEVPAQAFPSAGVSMQASLRVDLYNGSVLVLSSASAQLTLRSAAAAALSAPPAGVVLLLTLPTRGLHPGETFRATLSAFVGSQQAITGFTVKVLYNASRLTFVRADKSALWSELDAAPLPDDSGGMALWLSAIQRTAADSMYQNRTVPLLDAYFHLADSAGPDGAELVALAVGNGTSSSAGSVVWLSGGQPFEPAIVFQDFRAIAAAASGSIVVASPRQLGLLAYLTNHDLFNSAVLDGKTVVAPIQAFVVSDWPASGTDSTLTLPSGATCSCAAPANTSNALTVSSCTVLLTSGHRQPIKQARLSVACVGATSILQAQAVVSVWYPGSYRVELSDPDGTLSSLLPINVPDSAVAGCSDRFQSSRLYLLTTWINGGNSSQDDYLTDVDVTRLVANWTADAPQAVRLSGATATGVSPHPAVNVSAMSAGGQVLATTQVAVSSEPVCVEALEAVALSGVSISSDVPPSSLSRWRVRFTPQQALNWEGASAKVSVFATFSDGTVMPVSGASTTAPQPVVSATAAISGNTTSLSVLPFSLQPLSGNPSLRLTVNTSFGSPATCGPYLKTSWSMCSLSTAGGGGGVLMGTGSGTVRVALPTPTRIDSIQPSSLVVTSAGSGASQPPISVPTQSFLKVMVAFDDGGVRDMTNDSRVQVLVYQGADLCRVLRDSTTGQPYVEAIAGKSGNCELEARASFAGLPVLRNTTTTTVVTFMSLQVYVPDGTPALPPTTNSSVLTNLVLPIDPIYLFKCDFSHYMPASVWAMGQLSSCGASCNLADLNDPSITRLLLTDTSVANLATNPANVSLTNVLTPIKPGKSILRVSFGTAISNLFTVSVEDPFQPGWPRVLAITDAGFTIAANMSSGSYKVTYLVQPAADSNSSAALPSAAEVERAGVAMTALNCSQASPCMMAANVSGLAPATNYTVFLAVRFEVVRQSKLIHTVVAISGVLTPDNRPPTFTALGAVQNVTLDPQRFRLRIPVAMSETGTISYAIYRNSSCITGAEQLPVQTVRSAGSLPARICGCADVSLCQAVAWGNISLSGDKLSDVLSVIGTVPPNPYNVFSTATPDQLTCGSDYLPAPTTSAHLLYLVAQDDLPTYKDWNVTCVPPAASPGTSCPAAAVAPCTAVPPPFSYNSTAGGINVQTSPYTLLALGQAVPANKSGSPVLASFDLPAGDRVAFDQLATNVTVTSRTITFLFKVNKISAVQYRLDQFNGPKVFSGIFPVYDPAVSYTVTISKSCNGSLLGEPSYTLWYWATDVYGRSSLPLSASVVLG
ncbi:hypothetical protein PLESTB_001496700 [Pleodorina starrii]|uniref:Transmembrane protein family 132 middle domain-containing protein n=1 Tax=Pleodorina starrii TaxID=330485 RepID=A0A9W6BX88_9CHLO|nr:hypothetical protein PLESTB_001496700 [Pleodorina starrii]